MRRPLSARLHIRQDDSGLPAGCLEICSKRASGCVSTLPCLTTHINDRCTTCIAAKAEEPDTVINTFTTDSETASDGTELGHASASRTTNTALAKPVREHPLGARATTVNPFGISPATTQSTVDSEVSAMRSLFVDTANSMRPGAANGQAWIAGAVVGSVVGVAIIASLAWFFHKHHIKQSRREALKSNHVDRDVRGFENPQLHSDCIPKPSQSPPQMESAVPTYNTASYHQVNAEMMANELPAAEMPVGYHAAPRTQAAQVAELRGSNPKLWRSEVA